ncbi:MAG: flavin reductase family protein [Cellvibrionaceae bacterium]
MIDHQDLAEGMRAGMRHLASGVTVIATRSSDGVCHAMTVTSMTSISDDPPSLLVSLHDDSTTNKSFASTDRFSVNVLSKEQQAVSDRCAFTPEDEDRFLVGRWADKDGEGVPYLEGALANFICRVTQKISYGTHTIIIGDIEKAQSSSEDRSPLIYLRGGYL